MKLKKKYKMKRDKAEKLLQNNPKLGDYSERLTSIRSVLCAGDNKAFAQKLGVSTAYASSLCNAKEPITERTLQKILGIFPEVSEEWLYFGKGDMLSAGGDIINNTAIGDNNIQGKTINNTTSADIQKLIDTIATLTETNRKQAEHIGKLIEMLDSAKN